MARPTKYKPEYPELLIAHMSEGASFESFAAECRVSIPTLYVWCEQNPEFLEAKKIGVGLSMAWWEREARQNLKLFRGSTFNTAVWIYTMKCRFPDYWREDAAKVPENTKPEKIEKISDEDLDKLLGQASYH